RHGDKGPGLGGVGTRVGGGGRGEMRRGHGADGAGAHRRDEPAAAHAAGAGARVIVIVGRSHAGLRSGPREVWSRSAVGAAAATESAKGAPLGEGNRSGEGRAGI